MSEAGELGGEGLQERATRGDRRAQSDLLECYRSRLRRMVAIRLDRKLAARVDPSDVVQEAMKDAHNRLADYFADPRISFYPWLRRIVADRLADAYRMHVMAERRSVLKEHPWAPNLNDESISELAKSIVTSSVTPGQRALEAEMQQRAIAALGQLKPHDREILVMRYLEQMEVREIAEILDISETAVTSRHLRALQRLRRLIGN